MQPTPPLNPLLPRRIGYPIVTLRSASVPIVPHSLPPIHFGLNLGKHETPIQSPLRVNRLSEPLPLGLPQRERLPTPLFLESVTGAITLRPGQSARFPLLVDLKIILENPFNVKKVVLFCLPRHAGLAVAGVAAGIKRGREEREALLEPA